MCFNAALARCGVNTSKLLSLLVIFICCSNSIEGNMHATIFGTSLNVVLFCLQNSVVVANHLRKQRRLLSIRNDRRKLDEYFNLHRTLRQNSWLDVESTSHRQELLNSRHRTDIRKTVSIEPRIINGKPAHSGQFPFYSFPVGNWLCGSTLIYEDILLTAAHCFKAFVSYGVYIGGTEIDGSQSEYVPVDSEYPHVNYTRGYEYNDIMLVKLAFPSSSPVVEVDYTDVSAKNRDYGYEGRSHSVYNSMNGETNQTVGMVIGYGYTSTGEYATYSETLLQTDVDLLSINSCIDYYGPDIAVDTMLCATGDMSSFNKTTNETNDACLGDSGGPMLLPFYESLVIGSNGGTSRTGNDTLGSSNITVTKLAYKQIGIVSFGDGCGVPNRPAVYTKLSAFKEWIQNGICLLSGNPPTYCNATDSTSNPTQAPSAFSTTWSPTLQLMEAPIFSRPVNRVPPTTSPSLFLSDIPTARVSDESTINVPPVMPTAVISDVPSAPSSDGSTIDIADVLSDVPSNTLSISSLPSISPTVITSMPSSTPLLLAASRKPSSFPSVATATDKPSKPVTANDMKPLKAPVLVGDTPHPSSITVFELAYQDGLSNSVDTRTAPLNFSIQGETAPNEPAMLQWHSHTEQQNTNNEKKKKSKHKARGIIAADLFTVHDNDVANAGAKVVMHNETFIIQKDITSKQGENNGWPKSTDIPPKTASVIRSNSPKSRGRIVRKKGNNKLRS